MFILGLALGALFGLLLEQAAGFLAGVRTWIDLHPRLARGLRALAWLFLACLFVAGFYILAFADYDADNSYLPTPVVRAFHFITAPRQLKSLLGFFLGWFAFAYRNPLTNFAHRLGERILPRKEPKPALIIAISGADETPRAPGQESTSRSHIWLTSGVAIATLAAAALIAVAILQPDVFGRIVSFKFGDVVEARFSAAVEHSVRVNAPTFGGSLTARQLLQRGTELPDVIQGILMPTVTSLSAGLDPDKKTALINENNHAFLFLKKFAVPLAQVVKCYLEEFPVGDTEVLHEAVTVADQWRRLATGDDPADENIDQLAQASAKLLDQIKGKIPKGVKLIDNPPYKPYQPVTGCDVRPLDLDPDSNQTLKSNIRSILNNGMVISFVSTMVAFTQDFPTAATFLEKMDKPNDKGSGLTTDDPLGRFTFYTTRASAKYFARWYPSGSIKSDFTEARSEADAILATLSADKSNTALEVSRQYFEAERARLINNRLYYLLNESLQGRPLTLVDTDEVRTLRGQLKKWIATQPAGLYETKISGATGLVNKRRAGLLAPFYDTLATERIVMTQLAGSTTEQDCTQIRIYLDKAQDLYSEFAKRSGTDERDDLKIIDARRSMYESICGQNGRG